MHSTHVSLRVGRAINYAHPAEPGYGHGHKDLERIDFKTELPRGSMGRKTEFRFRARTCWHVTDGWKQILCVKLNLSMSALLDHVIFSRSSTHDELFSTDNTIACCCDVSDYLCPYIRWRSGVGGTDRAC